MLQYPISVQLLNVYLSSELHNYLFHTFKHDDSNIFLMVIVFYISGKKMLMETAMLQECKTILFKKTEVNIV